jgi:SAM-dependent methyltransferase
MTSHSQQFWDELFRRPEHADRCGQIRIDLASALQAAAHFFGSMEGKTLIDLGCGDGAASLFFAKCGAGVISLDQSAVAVENLRQFCDANGITSIRAYPADAFAIQEYGPADFIFGSMILHHVEPFADFVPVLRRALKPKGRAFFFENNSASSLLIWFRAHVVGKFGIPKYGDSDEFPLAIAEVNKLGQSFNLQQVFPELALFRLIPPYLLRRRFTKQFESLDRLAYRIRPLRKYSYRQYLFLENSLPATPDEVPVPVAVPEHQPQRLVHARSAGK